MTKGLRATAKPMASEPTKVQEPPEFVKRIMMVRSCPKCGVGEGDVPQKLVYIQRKVGGRTRIYCKECRLRLRRGTVRQVTPSMSLRENQQCR